MFQTRSTSVNFTIFSKLTVWGREDLPGIQRRPRGEGVETLRRKHHGRRNHQRTFHQSDMHFCEEPPSRERKLRLREQRVNGQDGDPLATTTDTVPKLQGADS